MKFELTVFGSSSAIPTAKRHPSAHLLNVNERFFLIDCGEGTQMQLRKHRVKIQRLEHIFISHLHGDHYFGLIGLLTTMHLLGREKELHLFGPKELMDIITLQLGTSETQLRYPLTFHPHPENAGVIWEDDRVRVSVFPLKHRIPTKGLLFRETPRLRKVIREQINKYEVPLEKIKAITEGKDFTTPDGTIVANTELTTDPQPPRSFAYCSDTAYSAEVVPHIKDVDMLFHEATFLHELKERADATLHSTAQEAGMIANEANANQLVIGHFSARYKNLQPLLAEAREYFPETMLAEEGKVYEVVPHGM